MAKDPLSGGFGSSPLGLARFILHLPNFFKLYWRLFTDAGRRHRRTNYGCKGLYGPVPTENSRRARPTD